MARARYLKPTFFTNERVGDLEPIERLVWAGLWCQADREGRLKDRPRELKLSVAPYDDVDVDAVLGKLMTAGFILRYEAEGRRYIYLPSFVEHQHPHPKEPPSVIPAPPPVPVLEIPEQAAKAAGTDSESRNESILTESESESESGSSESESHTAPLAQRARPGITKEYLGALQAQHPRVNVCEVYADARNRKTWDGYKDKRRALVRYVGWAEERTAPEGVPRVSTPEADKQRFIGGFEQIVRSK